MNRRSPASTPPAGRPGSGCRRLLPQGKPRAAVTAGDVAHQGEAEPAAASALRRRGAAVERLEDALAFLGRHARPVVAHLEHGAAGLPALRQSRSARRRHSGAHSRAGCAPGGAAAGGRPRRSPARRPPRCRNAPPPRRRAPAGRWLVPLQRRHGLEAAGQQDLLDQPVELGDVALQRRRGSSDRRPRPAARPPSRCGRAACAARGCSWRAAAGGRRSAPRCARRSG